MSPIPISRQPWRFGLTLAVFAVMAGVVAWRLWTLQIVDGRRYAELAHAQSRSIRTTPSQRGMITDATGAPLVESQHAWQVVVDSRDLEDKLRAVVELARILGVSRDEIREQLEVDRNGRTIARGVDDATAQAVRELATRLKTRKIDVRPDFVRLYREGTAAAHVLGYIADGKGSAGIELTFDQQLAGTMGREELQRDARGRTIIAESKSTPPRPGANVQLTIDLTIQRKLEEELAAAWEKHAPQRAAGIVVRPATGEIVAMASLPSFNPQTREGLSGENLRNNPLGLVYEPGSTFKPLIAGAAVHERLTSFNETIFCEHGRWTFRSGRAARTITDHSVKHGGHGNLTVTQGIALSDNILMAKLGIRMGVDRLHRWVESLGFGRKSGICLPGEELGIVPPRRGWTVISECMSIPMGHNIAVTPLQLSMAHAAVANGGVWNPPRLVKRVYELDGAGKEAELPMPPIPAPQRMFEATDAAEIQEAMTHVLTDGTGKNIQLDGYTAAGKTGTAEKLVGGRYSNEHHVGSFVCWAPADPQNPPALLALVVIDDPSKNGHYGSETAGPVVQQVLQFSLEHLRVPKNPAAIKDGPGKPDSVAENAPKPVRRRTP